MEKVHSINRAIADQIAKKTGTPVYIYDEKILKRATDAVLAFPHPFGLTVRYAMKACSTKAILQFMTRRGLHIDASSVHEVRRALLAGVDPDLISLSTQELSEGFESCIKEGVLINACSLNQLEAIGKQFPGSTVGVRFNPGTGSGSSTKTNTGGPASSFGIWHRDIDRVNTLAGRYHLKINRLHSHIGSGSDPEVWKKVIHLNLELVRKFPGVEQLNMGGGFKVGRMSWEKTTDLQNIGQPVKAALEAFARETGRRLRLEIEPGTILVAEAGSLLSRVQDMTETGEGGYLFLKLDTGMTDLLRPSLYGSQHPMEVLPRVPTGQTKEYIVVGHCCESGDLLTPAENDPGSLFPRMLAEASVGDFCAIGGTGAYCSSMPAKNYNSFPESPEVLLRENGDIVIIRSKQSLAQIVQNEIDLS